MPKTEVILTHNVVGLGGESDHVKVAAGYARNYLFPQGLAIPVTAGNKRRLEVLKQRRAERETHELSTMTELSQGLSKLTLVIAMKTGEDGRLFGSVTAGTIADELKHQFEATVEKRKIHLPHPIKKLGEHEVELRLHPEVVTTLKVRVDSTTPTAKPPEPPVTQRKSREQAPAKAEAAAKPEAKQEKEKEKEKERPQRKPRPAKSETA
jgi:large subunit ribosomal protein L9